MAASAITNDKAGYNLLLLLVAGLGGLLYGIDVGIIGGALPYLEATSGLTAGQLSVIVAAVLLGSVLSTLLRASWPTAWAASRSWSSAVWRSSSAFPSSRSHTATRRFSWPPFAGRQRRTDRRGRPALPRRVPRGLEPR